MRTAMHKLPAAAMVVLWLLVPAAAQKPDLPSTDDFPALDRLVASQQRRGLVIKEAEWGLEQAPADPATAALLFAAVEYDAAILDQALAVLHRLAASGPDDVEAAARLIADRSDALVRASARGVDAGDQLRVLVEAIHARIPEQPREQAARTARSLLPLDAGFAAEDRGQRSERLRALSRAFIEEYAGTEPALQTEVDLIGLQTDGRDQALLRERFESFARAHPGTTAGARALYQAGFSLHADLSPPRGADPTARFLRVAAIVEELESGRWPECEWVDRAPELVIGFYSGPDPTYAPDNIPRLLDAYRAFLIEHFEIDAREPLDNGIGWMVRDRIAALHEALGDRVGGVERFLQELENHIDDVDGLRFLRAGFLVRESRRGDSGADASSMLERGGRDTLETRGFELLETLAATATDPWARRAMATLASNRFYLRDFEHAIDDYQRFLARWPQSGWAWLAKLRLGQSHEALGDWEAAARVYREAARDYRVPAPAAVFANALAGRAAATLDRFDEAHRHYAEALAAWDDDYGSEYRLYTRHAPPPGQQQIVIADDDVTTRADLTARVDELSATLQSPEGPMLERGRRLVERERWREARALLERLINEHPGSSLLPDARYLAHRARFEAALAMADVESEQPDPAAAYDEMVALAGEPWDPAVGAAGLAVGAMLGKAGFEDAAEAATDDALQEWLTRQADYYAGDRFPAPSDPTLADDVRAIRDVVFRPQGGAPYDHPRGRWNAFDWPRELPAFLVVDPDLRVKLAGGETVRVRVADPLPDLENVLFLTEEHLGMLYRVLSGIGGTETRPPRYIMETPNQPVGASVEILELWRRFFPARPGHWSGWVLETYPIVARIEFENEARTGASVAVTIGYSGCTVHVERTDEGWVVTRLSNFWIT